MPITARLYAIRVFVVNQAFCRAQTSVKVGKENSPQSLTAYSRNRYGRLKKQH